MSSSDTQSINILAVDDDTGFCRALCSQFSNEFGIQAVHSASEALRTLAGSEIDLLFLDIGLPDISGMDLLKMVRDLYPQGIQLKTWDGRVQEKPTDAVYLPTIDFAGTLTVFAVGG